MSTEKHDVPLDAWISIPTLLEAEKVKSRREVYHQIDLGMPHSRIGRRIRVTRQIWRDWHAQHLVRQGAA